MKLRPGLSCCLSLAYPEHLPWCNPPSLPHGSGFPFPLLAWLSVDPDTAFRSKALDGVWNSDGSTQLALPGGKEAALDQNPGTLLSQKRAPKPSLDTGSTSLRLQRSLACSLALDWAPEQLLVDTSQALGNENRHFHIDLAYVTVITFSLGTIILELLTSGDPPTSASQSAGITGVSYRARPQGTIILIGKGIPDTHTPTALHFGASS
ncbi:hypothetical protein AAY473_006717 [Plecturocebus cupreus]